MPEVSPSHRAAATNITPAVGLDMEGYLREGPSVGVLDELTCQAVVFDDGQTRLVLAVADLMLTATHTHRGPGSPGLGR
jgi:hypothetical protein